MMSATIKPLTVEATTATAPALMTTTDTVKPIGQDELPVSLPGTNVAIAVPPPPPPPPPPPTTTTSTSLTSTTATGGAPAELEATPPSGTVTDPKDTPDELGTGSPDDGEPDTSATTLDVDTTSKDDDDDATATALVDTTAGEGDTITVTDDDTSPTGDVDDKKFPTALIISLSAALIMLGSFLYYFSKKNKNLFNINS